MITLVEARNYRCLRSVSGPLRAFQVLVGPNGSGKSAFMDVLGFLRDLVSKNLSAAVERVGTEYGTQQRFGSPDGHVPRLRMTVHHHTRSHSGREREEVGGPFSSMSSQRSWTTTLLELRRLRAAD